MRACHPGNRRRRLSGIHRPYVQNNELWIHIDGSRTIAFGDFRDDMYAS